MLLRITLVALLSAGIASVSFSQSPHYTKRQMKKNPVWIAMIESEQVNYYEAIKAFELYFTTHRFPVMEEEEMAVNEDLKERIEKAEKKFSRRHRKQRTEPSKSGHEKDEEAKLAFEVKKFNHWEMQVKPYVKDDGSIMSTEERMNIWKQSGKP